MAGMIIGTYRRLFAPRFFRKINTLLFRMSIRGLGISNYGDEKITGEAYLIKKILPILVGNGNAIFFDVGANVGIYSRALSVQFPNALIHTFEPHPNSYANLSNAPYECEIIHHNIAIGDCAGELTLYDRSDSDGSPHASLYEGVISEIHKKDVVSVEVSIETLDDISERENIKQIDFLKIDTEGHELAVLRGARGLIKTGRVGCIHFEFNEMNIISRSFFRDFRKTLEGYDFFRLLPDGLLSLDDNPLMTELFAFQNILAVPKRLRKDVDAQLKKHID